MAGKVEAPVLGGKIEIPKVQYGASKDQRVIPAKPDLMQKLNFPSERPPDWRERFLEKMAEVIKKYRSVRLFLDICVRCGACTDKCHFFIGTGDPRNMPVYRQEMMRSVYRRYFTTGGKLFRKLAGAEDLTEQMLEQWATYYYQCSGCRRCSVFCPYGIDTAEITYAAREIMDSIGIGSKYTLEIINKAETIGNNLGLTEPALRNTLDFVEEEIKENTGADVKLPLNVEGADILLVTPSADFFATPHIESLTGYAKVFHQAGVSWTLSSYASEAANFGLFVGNYAHMKAINKRIWDMARQLKVKRVIIGECGHAWRVLYSFSNTLNGPFDFLDSRYKVPQHICEFTLDLAKKRAFKFDKSANDNFTVTFHDSCNVARGSRMGDTPGDQFTMPRELINLTCNKFFDMPEGTIKEKTFCCGAGGGLLTDELIDLRLKAAVTRMQAYKDVKEKHNVNFLALICAICKAQFTKILPYYKYDMEEVGGVHQLISNAIVLGTKEGV